MRSRDAGHDNDDEIIAPHNSQSYAWHSYIYGLDETTPKLNNFTHDDKCDYVWHDITYASNNLANSS